MRSPLLVLAIAAACAALLGACETTRVVPRSRVCPPTATLAPGGDQAFALCDEPVPDSLVRWTITGPGRMHENRYDAPVIVAAPVSVVIHARGNRGSRFIPEGRAIVYLQAGAVPGADTCAGPAQAGLPDAGDYVELDELPVAITRVPTSYPDSARAHGIQGTVVVNALVCAGGNVIDTDLVKSIPELDDAARDAMRQWIFTPGRKNGVPYATWVVTPFRFVLADPAKVEVATPQLAGR